MDENVVFKRLLLSELLSLDVFKYCATIIKNFYIHRRGNFLESFTHPAWTICAFATHSIEHSSSQRVKNKKFAERVHFSTIRNDCADLCEVSFCCEVKNKNSTNAWLYAKFLPPLSWYNFLKRLWISVKYKTKSQRAKFVEARPHTPLPPSPHSSSNFRIASRFRGETEEQIDRYRNISMQGNNSAVMSFCKANLAAQRTYPMKTANFLDGGKWVRVRIQLKAGFEILNHPNFLQQ